MEARVASAAEAAPSWPTGNRLSGASGAGQQMLASPASPGDSGGAQLSYSERLERLRRFGPSPESTESGRSRRVKGVGSMLQRDVDMSEVIHSAGRGCRDSSIKSRDADDQQTYTETVAKWQSPSAGMVRSTSCDAHIVTWDGDVLPKPYGCTRRSSIGKTTELQPWPQALRPSWLTAAAMAQAEYRPTKGLPQSTLLSPEEEDSTMIPRRVADLEERWTRKQRVIRCKTPPPRSPSASPERGANRTLVQDEPFKFGDSSIWRCGGAWLRPGHHGSDAVELVGVGAQVHPLFRPTFRPTPRRVGVAAA